MSTLSLRRFQKRNNGVGLTVGRPAPQTCRPRCGSLVTLNTPPASVHSPLHQSNGGSGNGTHCSFALGDTKGLNIQSLVTILTGTTTGWCYCYRVSSLPLYASKVQMYISRSPKTLNDYVMNSILNYLSTRWPLAAGVVLGDPTCRVLLWTISRLWTQRRLSLESSGPSGWTA